MFDKEVFDAFLAGELDESLEGVQDARDTWKFLNENEQARENYDRVVLALRTFANVPEKADGRAFSEAEADMVWPVLWGQVLEDTRARTGLSKQALRHLATPSLVGTICAALRNLNADETAATITLNDPSLHSKDEEFEVSIAKVGGAVSLRLYKNEGMDVHCRVEGDAVTASNVDTSEVENWQGITRALQELSRTTGELLSDDTLLNGHVTVSQGRATVQLQALSIEQKRTR